MIAVLLPLALIAAFFVILVWGILYLASLYLHRFLAVVIGGIVILYLLQNMVRGILYCAEEPQFIPPSEDAAAQGGLGQMLHNCDGPGGAMEYMYLYVLAPLMIVTIGLLTVRYGRETGVVK
jgi:hypothetical protein